MKRVCFLSAVACFCAGIVLSGCNKDNGPGTSSVKSIVAQVVNGVNFNSEIDDVKAVMFYGEEENDYVVAEGTYRNGGFTILLPDAVDNKYLEGIGNLELTEEFGEGLPDGIKVSDPTARMGYINIEGYKSDEYIDDFIYAKFQISENKISVVGGGFCYVDKDVKITGSVSEVEDGYKMTISFNIFFKKGWNIMYASLSATKTGMTISATTKDPGGMKWYYEGDDDLDFLDLFSAQYQPETVTRFSMDKSKLFSPIKFLEVK